MHQTLKIKKLVKILKHKKIQKSIQKTINKKCRHLSMGMSGDYKEALKNGSTFIRIGTKLFKQRNEK